MSGVEFEVRASELLDLVRKDPGRVDEMFATGCAIRSDDRALATARRVFDALPKRVVADVRGMAQAIGADLESKGHADLAPAVTYLRGLTRHQAYARVIARVFSPPEPVDPDEPSEPSEPSEPDEPDEPSEPSEPSAPNDPDVPPDHAGIWFVVAVIVFVALVLGSLYVAIGPKIYQAWKTLVNKGGLNGPIVIHGPNDPNGPIGPQDPPPERR
jgi:hypothetical protein